MIELINIASFLQYILWQVFVLRLQNGTGPTVQGLRRTCKVFATILSKEQQNMVYNHLMDERFINYWGGPITLYYSANASKY